MTNSDDPINGEPAAQARRFFQKRLRQGLAAALGEMTNQPLTRGQARLAQELERALHRASSVDA